MTTSRETLGDFGHSMLESYQKLKIDYAEIKDLYDKAQKRIAELELAALKEKPEPPPE
jgi:hypothetical protein